MAPSRRGLCSLSPPIATSQLTRDACGRQVFEGCRFCTLDRKAGSNGRRCLMAATRCSTMSEQHRVRFSSIRRAELARQQREGL